MRNTLLEVCTVFCINNNNNFSSRRVIKSVKNFIDYCICFPQFYCESYQILWRCRVYIGTATYAPNFVEIGVQEHSLRTHILCGEKKKKAKKKKKKNTNKIISQELLGPFLSNLVCKVLFMIW